MTPQQALANLSALVNGWQGQPGMDPTFAVHMELRKSVGVFQGMVMDIEQAGKAEALIEADADAKSKPEGVDDATN